MGTITSKIGTLIWWLQHPKLYPELIRTIPVKTRTAPAPASERPGEALAWCEARAVSGVEALQRVTGGTDFPDFRVLFRAELAAAKAREAACPVRMGGAGDMGLVYHLAEHAGATRVIETGVAYGWSSLAILLSLRNRVGARLVSVDRPYPRSDSERYAGCVVPDELRPGWTLLQYADREGLPRALKRLPEIDLCHYDSDKSVSGRRWAYPKLWDALRPGGIFVSDDIGDNVAFRDFSVSVGVEPVVVRSPQPTGEKAEKFVGILRKPETPR